MIEGQTITLKNGLSEIEIVPTRASKVMTKYFGNEATGDLNNNKINDVAFLITQNSGGSGTFYYVVAALKEDEGYKGTNAVFLGDRIAPQTTEIRNGEVIVNYVDRKISEPMTSVPSVGISKYLKIKDGELVEVLNN
jgi:hypothetical protein